MEACKQSSTLNPMEDHIKRIMSEEVPKQSFVLLNEHMGSPKPATLSPTKSPVMFSMLSMMV